MYRNGSPHLSAWCSQVNAQGRKRKNDRSTSPSRSNGAFSMARFVRRPSESESSASASTSTSTSSFTSIRSSSIQLNLHSSFTNASGWEANGAKDRELTDAVLYMVCKDNMPLCTVEKRGFVHLMKKAVPRYKLPGVNKFKRYMEQKYNALKSVQQVCLGEVEYIAFTTDIWTEMMNLRSYLGVTGHYLNGDGTLHSVILGVYKLDSAKTTENLSQHLKNVCVDWHIPHSKVVVVVTDAGANIVAAVKDAFGEKKHLACFAHGLNLVAHKAVPLYDKAFSARDEPVVDEDDELLIDDPEEDVYTNVDQMLLQTEPKAILVALIKAVKNIVKFFKKSEVATRALKEIQEESDQLLENCLKLILDVRTRWNTIYDMVERFLALKVHISTCVLSLPSAPPMVSASQIKDLEDVVKVLRPLKDLTTKLCGQKYVTVSMVIPLLHLTKLAYSQCELHGLLGKDLKKRIQDLFHNQFKNTESNLILAAATILDPRFKKAYFTDPLNASKGVKYLCSLLRNERGDNNEEDLPRNESPANNPEAGSLEALHLQVASQYARANSRQQVSMNSGTPLELERYLLNMKLDDMESDPLQSWRGLRLEYPTLYKLVKRLLIIPATSVPSERLFSLCGQLITKLRNRLSAAHLDMLVFLNTVPDSIWFS